MYLSLTRSLRCAPLPVLLCHRIPASIATLHRSKVPNMPRIDPKKIPGARKAAMPAFLPPQLATLAKQPPTGGEWLHELKFDGYRMLCHLNKGKAKFWSRNAKDWTERFSSLERPLKKLPAVSAI